MVTKKLKKSLVKEEWIPENGLTTPPKIGVPKLMKDSPETI